jgi:dipeptidyl aminopeptidase/acylaminoacyl peptidase
MNFLRRLMVLVVALASVGAPQSFGQQTGSAEKPISITDLFALKELHDPQITPDGQWVAYAVGTANREEDKNEERIWMVPAAGGEAIALTAEDVSSSHPRWSPDGKFLAFLSARNEGKTQVWVLNRLGGEAQKLTETPQDVEDFEWAPDGKRLVLVLRDAKPEELQEAKTKEKKK